MRPEDAERLASLLAAAPLAVYECDLAGRARWTSPAFDALVRRAPDDPRPLHEACAPSDLERVRDARALARPGERLRLEWRVARPDGLGALVVDSAHARATPEGGVLLVGLLEDRSDEARRVAIAAEDARARALADLAAGVAHEINNPLSGVINYAQLAQRGRAGDAATLDEALAGILGEGLRIHELTRSLLTYTRRDRDQATTVQPSDLIRAALTPLRRELRDDLIRVSLEVPPDLPALQARGHELQLVLLRLLERARASLMARYPGRSEAKTLVLRAHADVDPADPNGIVVVVEVLDGGLGPPPEAEAAPASAWLAERCEQVVARHRGRLELGPGRARLILPLE